jgi:hypothetical protein
LRGLATTLTCSSMRRTSDGESIPFGFRCQSLCGQLVRDAERFGISPTVEAGRRSFYAWV